MNALNKLIQHITKGDLHALYYDNYISLIKSNIIKNAI